MKINMMITKEQAINLDNFLKEFNKDDDCYTFSSENPNRMVEYAKLANTLENLGMIKIIVEQDNDITAVITQEGRDFIEYGGFVKRYEVAARKDEMSKIELEKAKYGLRAAKREPYLIAWSIISTLATLIISLIKCK